MSVCHPSGWKPNTAAMSTWTCGLQVHGEAHQLRLHFAFKIKLESEDQFAKLTLETVPRVADITSKVAHPLSRSSSKAGFESSRPKRSLRL